MSVQSSSDPRSLAECIAPLNPRDRQALREHWDRVTAEEWIPPCQRYHRVPSLAELDERRARRRLHRQLTSVAQLTQIERNTRIGQPTHGSEVA